MTHTVIYHVNFLSRRAGAVNRTSSFLAGKVKQRRRHSSFQTDIIRRRAWPQEMPEVTIFQRLFTYTNAIFASSFSASVTS